MAKVRVTGVLYSTNEDDNFKVVDTLDVHDAQGKILEDTLEELRNPVDTNRIVDGAVVESKLGEDVKIKVNEAFNSPILVSAIEAGSVSLEDKQAVVTAMNAGKQLYFENGKVPVSYHVSETSTTKEFIYDGYYYKVSGSWEVMVKGKLADMIRPEQFVTDVIINGNSAVIDGVAKINPGPGLNVVKQSGTPIYFEVKAGDGIMLNAGNEVTANIDNSTIILTEGERPIDRKLQIATASKETKGGIKLADNNPFYVNDDSELCLVTEQGGFLTVDSGELKALFDHDVFEINDNNALNIKDQGVLGNMISEDAELSDGQLATASADVKGAVKVGNGLIINADGVLSAIGGGGSYAEGAGIKISEDGYISVKCGINTDDSEMPLGQTLIADETGLWVITNPLQGITFDQMGLKVKTDDETIIKNSDGNLTLATASATTKGGVKVGSGLTIDESGVLSTTGGGTSGVADVKVNNSSVVDVDGIANINLGPGFEKYQSDTYKVKTGDGISISNPENAVSVNAGLGLHFDDQGKLVTNVTDIIANSTVYLTDNYGVANIWAGPGIEWVTKEDEDRVTRTRLCVNTGVGLEAAFGGPVNVSVDGQTIDYVKDNDITEDYVVAPGALKISKTANLSDDQLANATATVKGGVKVDNESIKATNGVIYIHADGTHGIDVDDLHGVVAHVDNNTIDINDSGELYVRADAELSNGQLITASATDKGAIKIGDDFDVNNDDKLTFSTNYKQYIQSLVTRIENLEEELHPRAVYIDCYPSSIVTAEGGTITINLSNNFDASNMLLEVIGTSFGTLTKIDDRKYEYQIPADMSTSPRQVIVKATAVKDTVIKYTTETIIQKGYVQPYDCWIGSAGDEATAEDFNDSIDKVLQNDNFKLSLTSDSARKDYTIQVGDWEKIVMAFPKSFNITPANFYEGGFSGGVDMTTREIDGIEYNVLYSDAQDPSTHNITIK